MWAGNVLETRYRVNEFRRFIPRRGNSGLGLVQFWGPRGCRRYPVGTPRDERPPFDVGAADKLQTVEVSDIEQITDAKR